MKKIGLTIGKYAPFHKGHQLVIETALREMDELYSVIYETNVINIPLGIRASWIKKLYPEVRVIFAANPPTQYGLDEQAVKIQMDYLRSLIGSLNVTHFYSSEPYGYHAARGLSAVNREVDIAKTIVPICATLIRQNPLHYREYMHPFVFADVMKYCYTINEIKKVVI